MAPTEPSILEQYLLTPSQLPAIITPQDFTALFPRRQQSSPQIRTLYRDLQHQRNDVVDTVAENISNEVKRRRYFRQAAVTARRDAERLDSDRELERERMVWPAAPVICPSCIHAKQPNSSFSVQHQVFLHRNIVFTPSCQSWRWHCSSLRLKLGTWKKKRHSSNSR